MRGAAWRMLPGQVLVGFYVNANRRLHRGLRDALLLDHVSADFDILRLAHLSLRVLELRAR